jgi:hypothetical protein
MLPANTHPLEIIRARQQEIAAEREKREQAQLERDRPLIEAFAPIREFLEPLKLLHDDQFATGENPITHIGWSSVTLCGPAGHEFSIETEMEGETAVFRHYDEDSGQRHHRYSQRSILSYLTDFFARQLKPL